MQDKDTRGSLGETFSQFGAPPKKDAWEAIAARLDEPTSNRRAIIWWWSGGIAATLIIGWLLVTFQQGTSREETTNKVASGKTPRQKPAASSPNNSATADLTPTGSLPHAISQNAHSSTNISPTHSSDSRKIQHKKHHNRAIMHRDRLIGEIPLQMLPPQILPNPGKPLQEAEESPISVQQDLRQQIDSTGENDLTAVPTISDSSEDEPIVKNLSCIIIAYPKWRFGIYGMTANNDTDDRPVSEFSNETSTNISADLNTVYPNYQPAPQMRKDVGIKVTAGRAFLKGRLWLESGVQYNRYVTKRYEDLGPELLGNLTHESVGIPLTLSYNVVNYRRFTVGVSAGIVNQFFYKTVRNILIDNTFSIMANETSEGTTQFDDHFHLLSGIAGLEINYRITARWQLSLQPQFRYFLGTGTSSPWSDTFQRSWLGGTAGIRYVLYK